MFRLFDGFKVSFFSPTPTTNTEASTRSVQICTGLEALKAHKVPKTRDRKDPRGVYLKIETKLYTTLAKHEQETDGPELWSR